MGSQESHSIDETDEKDETKDQGAFLLDPFEEVNTPK